MALPLFPSKATINFMSISIDRIKKIIRVTLGLEIPPLSEISMSSMVLEIKININL